MDRIEKQAALSEAKRLRDLFGQNVEEALGRRLADALDSLDVGKAMFLLDVQTALYGTPVGYAAARAEPLSEQPADD